MASTIPGKILHRQESEAGLRENLSGREIGLTPNGQLCFKKQDGTFIKISGSYTCNGTETYDVLENLLSMGMSVTYLSEGTLLTASQGTNKVVFSGTGYNSTEDEIELVTLDVTSSGWGTTERILLADTILPEAVAPAYDGTAAYSENALVTKDRLLYRALRDTAAGWTSADWESISVADLYKEQTMPVAYFKTPQLATYELGGETAAATFSPTADVAATLSRMDDGSGSTGYLSGAVKNTVVEAYLIMGGAGTVVSRAVKAATVDVTLYIPAAAASSGSDTELSTFVLSVGDWSSREPKHIEIPAAASATAWASGYQATKPIAVTVESSSVFAFSDFNIQDDFKEQVLPVFLEIGVKAEKFLKSDMTEA